MSPWKISAIIVATGVIATACGGGTPGTSSSDSKSLVLQDTRSREGTATTLTQQTTSPTAPSAGRLLASQCAQCHGTDGHSVTGIDSLAGESASEIVEEMQEMKQEPENDIMHKQALGYSDQEIQLIAQYFAGLTGKGDSSESENEKENEYDDD